MAHEMTVKLLLLLIASSLVWNTQSRRTFAFTFKTCDCLANRKYITLIDCSVREVNSITSIFMDITLAQDVGKITFDLLVLLPNSRSDLVLFNMNQMNGCVFLENTSPFQIVQIIRKEFQKYSNMPNKCPVSKGTSIKVSGLKLDPENFPSYVPETKFHVRVRIYEAGNHLFNLTINGTCENNTRTRRFFFKG